MRFQFRRDTCAEQTERGPVCGGRDRAGRGSDSLPSSTTNPRPTWPLAIAWAETEKLGMRGARGARPGQITIYLWDIGPQLSYLLSGLEVPVQMS